MYSAAVNQTLAPGAVASTDCKARSYMGLPLPGLTLAVPLTVRVAEPGSASGTALVLNTALLVLLTMGTAATTAAPWPQARSTTS